MILFLYPFRNVSIGKTHFCRSGKILTARDAEGAVRILEFGNIPFSEEVKSFHYRRLKERADNEKREVDFNMTIDDVYSISDMKSIIKTENQWWENEDN